MFILFDILLLIVSPIFILHVLLKGKWHKRFPMRFGFLSEDDKRKFLEKKNIWVHAVSVGEVLAVLDVIHDLKKIYPQHRVVLSTVTKTGYALALEKLSKDDYVIFAPIDFSLIVKKFIRAINPVVYIAAETEIWPNLFTFLNKHKVPIAIINGRISDKSNKRYQWVKMFMKPILDCVDAFCMQSYLDLHRIKCLGADETRGKMVGNLKFDLLDVKVADKQKVPFGNDVELLIAGSTHPGEEEVVIKVYQKLSSKYPPLRLIIVPRHVERIEDVVSIVERYGFQPVKFSKFKKDALDEKQIVVVDKIGVLKDLYAQAKLVFVGKSFMVGGGQNMIEPLMYGKPTFVGPRTENFTDVMRIFLEEKVIYQVSNADELIEAMREILESPEKADELSVKAKSVIEQNRGARSKTVKAIKQVIDEQS